MKKCIIITGGEHSTLPVIEKTDFVIACDKGLEYAKESNVTPDLVIGDFDSYNGDMPKNLPIMRLKCEKDDTDTMTAVRYAVDKGYGEILLCCALGGRFDHELANIQSAVYAVKHGAKAAVLGDNLSMYFLQNEKRSFPKRENYSLSVFSMTDTCTEVCISGAKYPLQNAVLTSDFPIGVSNEWLAPQAEISVGKGILMVVETNIGQKK